MLIGLTALMLATLFAGAALYISLVEHPARLCLDDGAMLAQWQPSYRRALTIQAGLAVLGGVAGLIVWFQSDQWQWLAGAVLLLANWPFTLLGIMPTNKRLVAMQPADVNADARRLMLQWGRLHSGRSALGTLAALTYAWVLLAR